VSDRSQTLGDPIAGELALDVEALLAAEAPLIGRGTDVRQAAWW